jgi:hypothetical protein
VARAGFAAYYARRPGYVWETTDTKIWWEQIAARILNGTITKTQQAHEYYNRGRLYPVEWSDISTTTCDRWVQAWWAMIRVRDGERHAA